MANKALGAGLSDSFLILVLVVLRARGTGGGHWATGPQKGRVCSAAVLSAKITLERKLPGIFATPGGPTSARKTKARRVDGSTVCPSDMNELPLENMEEGELGTVPDAEWIRSVPSERKSASVRTRSTIFFVS